MGLLGTGKTGRGIVWVALNCLAVNDFNQIAILMSNTCVCWQTQQIQLYMCSEVSPLPGFLGSLAIVLKLIPQRAPSLYSQAIAQVLVFKFGLLPANPLAKYIF